MNQAGLEMNPDNIFSVGGQQMRGKAKELTAKQQVLYMKGRLGLVIDGTGRDAEKIIRQNEKLKELGYSTAMIFVNTDKETALRRNMERARKLEPKEVAKMWDNVQRNVGKYQRAFKSRLTIVDNSDGKDYNKETTRAFRIMKQFADKKPMNPIAQKWIKTQKEETNPRIPRKKGQPANSKKHSDLYTDENPRGTIHGLGFKDVETARASVKKIENSGKKHAHKIQAAIAMEQRAKEMGKTTEAAVYRAYIEKMKKKTKEMRKEDAHGFKCPSGYKFDRKLMACVPKRSRFKTVYAYPYFGGGSKSGDQSGQSQDGQNGNGNGNAQSGNGNGGNGNGGNGNGGGNGGGGISKKDLELLIEKASQTGPTQTIRIEQAPIKISTDEKPYQL